MQGWYEKDGGEEGGRRWVIILGKDVSLQRKTDKIWYIDN